MPGFELEINDRFRNRKVDFFNEFNFNLKHDAVCSDFGFNFYFDPNISEHKEMSCVTHFHEVTVKYNDEVLITGNITNQRFKQSSKKQLSSFGGYSKTGVLEDCEIPIDVYPLQADSLSLKQIAEKILKPFKLNVVIDPAVASKMDKVFKKSVASESQTIKSYLTELASQKNIIITHNEKGDLLFTEVKDKIEPLLIFDLTKETPIGYDFEFEYDGQAMHSVIHIQKQAGIDGGNAGSQKIRNPYVLQSVYRPTVKSQSSGDDNDTVLATNRALSNELSAIKLTIQIDRWDINGKIIRPNNIIRIYAPELYIFKETDFFIESVNYTGNNESTTATLNCVLPEVYTNKVPVSMFAGINLHA